MNVLYLTTWVLGDAGANAAEIFPKLAAGHPEIGTVIVADFPENKSYIQDQQSAQFLKLEPGQFWLRYAVRIARKCRQDRIDIVHVFYRQQNAVLLVLIRLVLWIMSPQTKLAMDHRSVNLAKGFRRVRKLILNQIMQVFSHHLAGNPWAIESNHVFVFKQKHCIDLGYDKIPNNPRPRSRIYDKSDVNVWFIGSLKPKNRKSEFLLDVFDILEIGQKLGHGEKSPKIRIHVAGPTNSKQAARLGANTTVRYHGKVPRPQLYKLLQQMPGIGLAFMNSEFHEFAPSLKFSEYAIMRFRILASKTIGLRNQAERMKLTDVTFLDEDPQVWADAVVSAASLQAGLQPLWETADDWSYESIFEKQVIGSYREISR